MLDSGAEPALLILTPTGFERDHLAAIDPKLATRLEICGFGPIAAAARTSELIGLHRPARVMLIGIAGTFDDDRLSVGSAAPFGEVAIDGIGAGVSETFRSASELGFPQWSGSAGDVGERIALESGESHATSLLLTVCAAAATPREAEARCERFPGVLAEEMEGFGVALACSLFAIPLTIIRGISNRVGDRNSKRWRTRDALSAAATVLQQRIAEAEAEK